jgi:pimeloyl-ACP methyl ester carboxylesterase
VRTLRALITVLATSTPEGAPHAETSSATYESAPCPVPNVAGHPELDLGPHFSCGFLTVPENRASPNGRTIRIAVTRVKAQSPHPEPDPLLYLTGGPGGSGLAVAGLLAAAGLTRDRDLVVIDQRGTLHSAPALTCPEIDRFLDESTSMPVMASVTAERDVAAVRACRDRLAGDGHDLTAYNTTENAADIADLRTALDIDTWNIYGVSYGSHLALQVLRDHPDGIRSVIVDSVAPPQVNLIEQFWPSAAEGLHALFDACDAQPECARAYPELPAEFTATVHRLARQPVTAELPGDGGAAQRRVVIDGYTLANLVVSATLNSVQIPLLPKAIHAIATGDPVPAARIYLTAIAPEGFVGYGLTYGVFCREDVAFTDTAAVRATGQRVLPDLPAEVLSLPPQTPRLFAECPVWNAGRADNAVHEPTRSEVPALLLAGALDAVTPPSQAELAARTLPHGRVVRFADSGHDVLSRSVCAQHIVVDFLDDPTGYDTCCASAIRTPAFDN